MLQQVLCTSSAYQQGRGKGERGSGVLKASIGFWGNILLFRALRVTATKF